MFGGPVAHFELVRIARKRRTFVLRFVFGLVVFGIIALAYLEFSDARRPWYNPGEVSLGEMARFGQTLFWSIMAAQACWSSV
jgi:hypothetical protein